jgi:hypothetical protein
MLKMILRSEFSQLAQSYGDEFRNALVRVRLWRNRKLIYRGRAIDIPQEILDMPYAGNCREKDNIAGFYIE